MNPTVKRFKIQYHNSGPVSGGQGSITPPLKGEGYGPNRWTGWPAKVKSAELAPNCEPSEAQP